MPFDSQPTLRGALVTLRPLRPDDFSSLYEVASDPLVWEQHPARDRHEESVFRQFFDEAIASGGALLAIDSATGRTIGSSRFHGYDEARAEVEIGWTFLARSHWGGRYNGAMKEAMLRHAFRWVRSVVFYVNPRNVRSRLAVEKIGGVLESEPDGEGRLVLRITASAFGRRRVVEPEIRVAAPSDARVVSEVLSEAARWLEERGIGLWSLEQVSVGAVAPDVASGLYYLAWSGPSALGAMRLTRSDPAFWPEALPGEALYLHRLAVRRAGAGGEVSSALLRFAATRATDLGARYLRLDCESSRASLRGVYERFGFQYHSERTVGRAHVARYQLAVPARLA